MVEVTYKIDIIEARYIIDRSLEVKFPNIETDEQQRWAVAEKKVREQRRRKIKGSETRRGVTFLFDMQDCETGCMKRRMMVG